MSTSYDRVVAQARRQHGDKFSDCCLDKRYIPYFNNLHRIKVRFKDGIKSGNVNMTTGWRPVFILMLTFRSRGSSHILDETTEILGEGLRIKGRWKYCSV